MEVACLYIGSLKEKKVFGKKRKERETESKKERMRKPRGKK
jgi:hypothetical protein